MSDIVERLRAYHSPSWGSALADAHDAADEIERLRAELQHARDGLTKGRTRMREDIERLRAAAEQARAALDPFCKTDLTVPLVRDTFGFDVLRARVALEALDAALEGK